MATSMEPVSAEEPISSPPLPIPVGSGEYETASFEGDSMDDERDNSQSGSASSVMSVSRDGKTRYSRKNTLQEKRKMRKERVRRKRAKNSGRKKFETFS